MAKSFGTKASLLRYNWNCPYCEFLGRFEDERRSYDLYYDDGQGNHSLPTVIAVYGNDDGEYLSGLANRDESHPLRVAADRIRRRAFQEGEDAAKAIQSDEILRQNPYLNRSFAWKAWQEGYQYVENQKDES
jgi:hypothetical protein